MMKKMKILSFLTMSLLAPMGSVLGGPEVAAGFGTRVFSQLRELGSAGLSSVQQTLKYSASIFENNSVREKIGVVLAVGVLLSASRNALARSDFFRNIPKKLLLHLQRRGDRLRESGAIR